LDTYQLVSELVVGVLERAIYEYEGFCLTRKLSEV